MSFIMFPYSVCCSKSFPVDFELCIEAHLSVIPGF